MEKICLLYISNNIKKRRVKLKLTQEEVSKLSGIPRSYLNQIEKGKIDLKVSTLIKIATALKVNVGYFFANSVRHSKQKMLDINNNKC